MEEKQESMNRYLSQKYHNSRHHHSGHYFKELETETGLTVRSSYPRAPAQSSNLVFPAPASLTRISTGSKVSGILLDLFTFTHPSLPPSPLYIFSIPYCVTVAVNRWPDRMKKITG